MKTKEIKQKLSFKGMKQYCICKNDTKIYDKDNIIEY